MSAYYNDHIKLKKAMTMNLEQTSRFWYVKGLQLKEFRLSENFQHLHTSWLGIQVKEADLPENALAHVTFLVTFVTKSPDGSFSVGVEWRANYGKGTCMSTVVDEFKTLDELQEKFPNLFDLYGRLFAIVA